MKAATIIFAGVLLTAGFFSTHIPVFYFKASQVNAYYWYCNYIPPMEQHKEAGEWLGERTPEEATYGVEWDTKIDPFFYGRRPLVRMHEVFTTTEVDYILVNPSLLKEHAGENDYELESNLGKIYNSGQLVVYGRTK